MFKFFEDLQKLSFMIRLSILILICLFSSCSFKPVMITAIKDVKTANISGEKVELAFNLEIDNPNGFKIVLKQYDMDVMLNDKGLGKASSIEKIAIKRKSKETHPFKLSASYKDFMSATVTGLGALLNREPVTFKVKGAIKGRIWWFKKNIPIETTQKIKL